jgi:hypothetical protein
MTSAVALRQAVQRKGFLFPIPCSVVRAPGRFVGERWFYMLFPFRSMPCVKRGVRDVILLQDRVRAHDHVHPVFFPDESLEMGDARARRIADHHAGRKMDHGRAVLLHFLGRILDIAAGTAVARGVHHDLDLLVLVNDERAFPLTRGAEALAPGAGVISMTNDYPDFYSLHDTIPFYNAAMSMAIIIKFQNEVNTTPCRRS